LLRLGERPDEARVQRGPVRALVANDQLDAELGEQ
jgi:hypothetical protein